MLIGCLLKTSSAANRTITVSTAYGDVLGVQTATARIFYRIPFAKPPVGNFRYYDAVQKLSAQIHMSILDGIRQFQSLLGRQMC